MKNISLVIAAATLCGVCGSAAAAVTASLDRDEVAGGETVQLTLQHDSQGGGDPDLAPLNKDFEVLGTSTSSNIELVNGHFTSQRALQITLAPKRGGTLPVPPLSWGGEQSQPLRLTVSDGGNGSAQAGGSAAAGQAAHVFLTSALDQRQPYVQGSAVLTVQVHADQPLYQASLDFSGDGDIAVQQIGKDRQTSEERGGRHYDVIERKYLLQPQRSGRLSLDGPALDAQVATAGAANPFGANSPFGPNSPFARAFGGSPFAGMVNTMRPLRLHGDAVELDVRPRPAGAAGRDWLPARQITLEQSWRPDNASVHAGDPLTLHLRMRAKGLAGAQLPDLSAELALPDGLKAYPDQPKLDTALESGEVVGTREQDIAIVADRAGHYEVPALHVSWWDTQQDAPREAVLPERALDVLPAAGGAATPPAQQQPAAPAAPQADTNAAAPAPAAPAGAAARSPWAWVSLGLGLLWAATLLVWWLRRRRPAAPPRVAPQTSVQPAPVAAAGEARRAFHQACRENDAAAARRHLLQWARVVWPDQPPAGLEALARRLDRPAAAGPLQQLDRACYAGGEWRGAELAGALQSLEPAAARPERTRALPDLYS